MLEILAKIHNLLCMGYYKLMKTVIVDINNNDVTTVDMSEDEKTKYNALQSQLPNLRQSKEQAQQQRQDAIQTILNSSAISADPNLQAALSILLNPQQ